MALAGCRRIQTRLVIVTDQLGAFFGCLTYRMVGDQTEASDIVEDGFQPVVEQRQPMFHAGKTAAFGDGGIKRVVAGRSPEQRQIVLAEPADRLGRQRDFAHRVEVEGADLADGPLVRRIE